ncbi:MAG: LysM peptidoglycan-binding domain-containing protein, partial [Alphaproteobacteria bacterium]|nr:LysM peptidoglycan-binding domain-containing protein [Alphaproteobacteria bacterium]
MKKIIWIFAAVLITQTACDLQPKIQTLPDSVGDFISSRYPALLADPNENPEIYNSAAMDYGVYASPELYGHDESDDYVTYASVDDYIIPGQVDEYGTPPQVDVGEQIVKAEKVDKENTDDYLVVPMYGGVKSKPEKKETKKDAVESDDVLTVKKPGAAIKSVKKVELKDVIVASGDTLYSLSRKYSVPVNDLAVMNNLKAPFNLTVGQKLRVPNLDKISENAVVEVTKKSQKTSVKEEKK